MIIFSIITPQRYGALERKITTSQTARLHHTNITVFTHDPFNLKFMLKTRPKRTISRFKSSMERQTAAHNCTLRPLDDTFHQNQDFSLTVPLVLILVYSRCTPVNMSLWLANRVLEKIALILFNICKGNIPEDMESIIID